MNVIVLSFDTQSGFAELTYKKYCELWPDSPFRFRIPFNDVATNASYNFFASQPNIGLIQTPPDIRSTMTALLSGLPDEEWVFWCIDDRYPITMYDINNMRNLCTAIARNDADGYNGVKLFAWREEWSGPEVTLAGRRYRCQNPSTLFGFWHHHFVKVGVLRYFFLSGNLPNLYTISDLTRVFHFQEHITVLEKTLVPQENDVVFGEPCVEGKLTLNGFALLKEYGCPIPPYTVLDVEKDFVHNEAPAIKKRVFPVPSVIEWAGNDGSRAPTLEHYVNPVALPPEAALSKAQQITFLGMEKAWKLRGDVPVELRTVQFAEDHAVIPPFFTALRDLDRSVLDDRAFSIQRKLPFLADILERIVKYSIADFVIFTNVDIIPSQDFYLRIRDMIGNGRFVFTINRRTIIPVPNTVENLESVCARQGTPHPGHDCFIFPRRMIGHFDVGKVIVGVPWLGFTLLANCACVGGGVDICQELFLTRHLGNDAQWNTPEQVQYRDYNTLEAAAVLDRLQNRFGRFKQSSYIGQHVLLARRQAVIAGLRRQPSIPARRENRLIFCINSGRCGSEYLKTVLASALNVTAFHEAEPAMCGDFLKMATTRSFEESAAQRRIKVRAIEETLDHLPPGQVYAETNHMFIKTFYDVTLDAFSHERITVVLLRRDLVKVLKSFIDMGYFTARNNAWPLWMHQVPSQNSALKPFASFHDMDVYDRAISYLIDIEARAQQFKRRFRNCTIVDVMLEDIQTPEACREFCRGIGLEPTPYTAEIAGSVVNARKTQKERIRSGATEEVCRQRIIEYIDRSAKEGISLPELAHFRV